ncbi:serine hydrolase [Leptospira sp. 96542]|nr:serine hydrolase [Leptospira sp. 96542]
MKQWFVIGAGALIAIVCWMVIVVIAGREGLFRPLPVDKNDTAALLHWAESRYKAQSQGNIAIMLIQDGIVKESYFASNGRTVDDQSLFQVASLSKWVTAWGVMTLVEQNRIDLDAPVLRYLKRWHLPEAAPFDNDDVTVRRLLAHTAGLTDGLGFLGFPPEQNLPSIEEELTNTTDAMPGASGVVRVGAEPGSHWRYSGGGYLILQLLIEEVSQEPFNTYMRRAVLLPLGMAQSTYVDPDPAHLVDFFEPDGSLALHYKFTALGAASLYTSAADLTRFLQAHLPGPNGSLPGRGVLMPTTLGAMHKPNAFLYGLPVWGLGPTLYAPDGGGGYIIGHDGTNFPAINTSARTNLANRDGIIVLETGSISLAREIAGQWTFWQTGIVPLDTLVLIDGLSILITCAAGSLLILLGAGFVIHYRWR